MDGLISYMYPTLPSRFAYGGLSGHYQPYKPGQHDGDNPNRIQDDIEFKSLIGESVPLVEDNATLAHKHLACNLLPNHGQHSNSRAASVVLIEYFYPRLSPIFGCHIKLLLR